MKALIAAGLVLALLVPACALARSPFDGTWKLDPTTLHTTGGSGVVISVKDGVYKFQQAGSPTLEVKADGADHPVTGFPGYNSVAIELVNDHAVKETDKQDGKIVGTSISTVAADGKTGTSTFTDDTGPKPASGQVIVERVGQPVPGSNAVAGRWKLGHYVSLTNPATNVILKVVGDQLSMSDEAGAASFTATLGGKPAPLTRNGKPAGTVSVRQVDKTSLSLTYATDGKVTRTMTLKLAKDARSLEMITHNSHTGATTTMVHNKA